MAKIQLKSDNINPFGGDCPKSQTFLSENPESASEVSRSQGNFKPLLPTGPKAFFQCQITEAAISQDPESLLMNISSAHASRTELTLNMPQDGIVPGRRRALTGTEVEACLSIRKQKPRSAAFVPRKRFKRYNSVISCRFVPF